MSERRNVLLFFQSFVLIALALWVLGELYLMLTAPSIADQNRARLARETAGLAFGAQYHLLMILASLVIASAIAFRSKGALIGGVVAIVLSLVLDPSILRFLNLASLEGLTRKWQEFGAEPKPLAGRQMVLVSPITVQSRYGKATIPAGTRVKVLREEGDSIWINVLGGETTIVTRAYLR
jgi:hypothetical protein